MNGGRGTLVETGDGRSIGAAVSRLAAARGYSVAVNYPSDKVSADVLVIQEDVGKEKGILRLFGFARVDSVEGAMVERLLAVNITGAILCSREAVRQLSTKHGGPGGAILTSFPS